MKYLHPFTFLEKMNSGPVDTGDAAALSLLRKKMMAELELTAEKILWIEGVAFSKNDLLQFFDGLQSPVTLQYYQQINQDTVLLTFLTTGKLTGLFNDNPLYRDARFITFISPYYEPLFTGAVLQSLQTQDATTLQGLFANPLLIDATARNKSDGKIFRVLQQQYQVVETEAARRKADWHSSWQAAAPYITLQYIHVLNVLPELFQETRNEWGLLLINFAIMLDATGESKKALEILRAVNQLHCGFYVQEVRQKYLQQLEDKAAQHKSLLGRFFRKGDSLPSQRKQRRRDLFIRVGVTVVIVAVIVIGARMEPKYTPTIRVGEKETSILFGARTSRAMQYLLLQILRESDEKMKKLLSKPILKAPVTGTDVYGPDFMRALHMQGDYGKDYVPPPFGRLRRWREEDSAWNDEAHRQSMRIGNRLDVALIAMVQTPDSFYSCYIASFDTAFVPLPLSVSRVYFYAGFGWDPDWVAPYALEYVPGYRARGFFLTTLYDGYAFLENACLQFNLDTAYWQHSNRYIPLEVSVSPEQKLQLRQLNNNFNGVDMIPVE